MVMVMRLLHPTPVPSVPCRLSSQNVCFLFLCSGRLKFPILNSGPRKDDLLRRLFISVAPSSVLRLCLHVAAPAAVAVAAVLFA